MASQPASAMQQPAGRGLHTEGSELRSYSYSDSDASAATLPFAQLLANAASGGSDWKVLLFFSLHEHPRTRLPYPCAVLCTRPGQHTAQGINKPYAAPLKQRTAERMEILLRASS